MQKDKTIPEIHKHVLAAILAVGFGLFFGLIVYPKVVLQEGTVPAVPQNVVVESQDSSIYLTWDAPRDDGGSPITNYIIAIALSDNLKDLSHFSAGLDSSYLISDLTNGVSYSVSVAAENKDGTGEFSVPQDVVPIENSKFVLPNAPETLSLMAGDSSISVTWDTPVDNGEPLTFYKIYYSESDKNSFTVIEIPFVEKMDNSYTINSLTNDTEYTVYMTAVNANGEGDPTDLYTATPTSSGGGGGSVLEFSDSPTVTTTSNSATITWNTTKVSSSLVYYGPIDNFSGNTPESNTTPRVSGHSVTISNLPSCVKFWFKAASYDDSSNYIESLGGEFTTKGCKGDSVIIASDVKKVTSSVGASVEAKVDGKGITVDVPAAVKDGTSLAIEALKLEQNKVADDISAPSGKTWAGDHAYSLKALENETTEFDGNFDQSVSVTIDYTDADLNGINPDTLKIYHYEDSSGWMPLINCSNHYDGLMGTGMITCDTTSFSVFGLFGEETTDPGPGGVGTAYKGVNNSNSQNMNKDLVQDNNLKPQSQAHKFTKDLYFGLYDSEVRFLQIMLNKLGFLISENGLGSSGQETNYFGPKTKDALSRFQEAYKDQILTPLGLNHGTGFFGEKTRTVINNLN